MSNVSVNAEQEVYVIPNGGGYSCYGFDNTLDEIDRITTELVGRGVMGETDAATVVKLSQGMRGNLGVYQSLLNLRQRLKAVCEAQGDTAVCGLSPQLVGLEGYRVEVEDMHGETRRFIVGKSTGWLPIHLEIARRDSSGGMGASREYKSVRSIERVRYR